MNLDTNPPPYGAYILADSRTTHPHSVRLTTFVVNFPRIVLAEFNTHRVFSRNSASSRAIPVKKRIKAIQEDPYIPLKFGKNKRGMQSTEDLDEADSSDAEAVWRTACKSAIAQAEALANIGVHKQFANRLLEPFAWHTVIVTATEWDNFWALRDNKMAQPEIALAAKNMREAYQQSEPEFMDQGDWHLPLTTPFERDTLKIETLRQVSVARCARVSYETHGGERDLAADIKLYQRLVTSGHMSPLEHVATVVPENTLPPEMIGNFRQPWLQFRKTIKGEAVFQPTDDES